MGNKHSGLGRAINKLIEANLAVENYYIYSVAPSEA